MGRVTLETVAEGSWVEEERAEVSPDPRSAGRGVVLATSRSHSTTSCPALSQLRQFVLISEMGTVTSTCAGLW